MAPNIFIALPDYGGVIKSKCVLSLIRLMDQLRAESIKHELWTFEFSNVSMTRNYLASAFFHTKSFSHLLFIDSDMTFRPSAVTRLLKCNKPLVGCVYPRRSMDFDRALALAKTRPPAIAVARSSKFVVQPDPADPEPSADGLLRVHGLGMGLCLIDRVVFDRLTATKKIRYERSEWKELGPSGVLYGYFDLHYEEGNSLSEDLSFCKRWRELCDGEVWAVIDEPVGHIGDRIYESLYTDSLKG